MCRASLIYKFYYIIFILLLAINAGLFVFVVVVVIVAFVFILRCSQSVVGMERLQFRLWRWDEIQNNEL